MEDLWSDLGCIDDENTIGADSKDIYLDEMTDLNLSPPIPLTTDAFEIKRRGSRAPPSSGESTSTKTSETTDPSSSNFTTPSMPFTTDSPLHEKLPLQDPASIPQSNDSIAQMLEYMRACNSRDSHSPPFSSSFREQISEGHSQQDSERQTYRKKERTKSSTVRKQRSPIQKIKRSLSQGGDARSPTRKVEGFMPHRLQQRSKTSLGQASDGLTAMEKELQIDTQGAVNKVGPSGLPSLRRDSHGYEKQSYSASAGREQQWMTSASPVTAGLPSTSWPVREASQNGERGQGQSLSLMEYLNRPEGAAWSQHFQNRFPNTSNSKSNEAISSAPGGVPRNSSYSSDPIGNAPVPNYMTALPATGEVINALGLQQAPDFALIQAFQTAFILGMQQLNMAGQLRHRQESYRPPSSMWPLPDHHFSAVNTAMSNSSPPLSAPAAFAFQSQSDVRPSKTQDSSAVLEGLLHDINQQRADQQDFSLDEFLAYVATTVESRAEAQAHDNVVIGDTKTAASELVHGDVKAQTNEQRAMMDTSNSNQLKMSNQELAAKKKPRRRTISISGHLSKTHLIDLAEEGKMDDVDESVTHEMREAIPQEGRTERKPLKQDDDEEMAKVKARKRKGRKAKFDAASSTHSASIPHVRESNVAEVQAGKVAERRRRRRESHNAVERRRRDHINERIAELASLLPESMLLEAIEASTGGGTMPHIDLSLFVRRPTNVLDINRDHREGSPNELDKKANALEPVHSSSETLALAQSKPNKGIILSKSVDYIKHLHEFCSVLRTKNKEMQKELDELKDSIFLASVRPSAVESHKDRVLGEDQAMSDVTPPPTLATWLQQQQKASITS